MVFTGWGLVWNYKTGKLLVDFNNVGVYETNDDDEIVILKNCNQAKAVAQDQSVIDEPIVDEVIEPEDTEEPKPELSEKEKLIIQLNEAGIEYDKRWGVKKLKAALAEA
jgi:hypothetical protein